VRVNGEINAPEVRLVGVESEPLGIVSIAEAMRQAEVLEIDLVEIAPTAKPPVCRLMDYGKFKYREAKRMHDAKVKQKQIQVKEVKFRPGTDDGDYAIKVRNLIRFLEEGDKTKVTLRFRGRELSHQELGYNLLKRVEADLAAHGAVEQFPKMEGRQMIMVLAPKKKIEKIEKVKGSKEDGSDAPAAPVEEVVVPKPVVTKVATVKPAAAKPTV
jgi:translation initiation factor IF-3